MQKVTIGRVLYVSDVSKRLRKSPETIRRWIRKGIFFHAFHKLGKEWATTEDKLEKYLRDDFS